MSYDTNQELRTIKLTGILGRKFGRVHRLAVETPAEAIRALIALKDGFRAFLEKSHENGIAYKFSVAGNEITKDGLSEEVHFSHGANKEFTLAPVLIGSKNAIGQIIVGIVIVIASIYTGGAAAAAYGAAGTAVVNAAFGLGMSLILGGVTQLLSPKIKTNGAEEKEKSKPSAIFNGAVNTVAQGQPVPFLYGRMIVGSAVISAGISSQNVAI